MEYTSVRVCSPVQGPFSGEDREFIQISDEAIGRLRFKVDKSILTEVACCTGCIHTE